MFPRIVREDPFLRDPARRVIRDTIGYKIGQKMTALEEERLLLQLILTSARRSLYVTFQRSDDEGKIVGASSFLRRLVEEWGVSMDDVANVVPRRLTDKIALVPPALLSPKRSFFRFPHRRAGRGRRRAGGKPAGADAPRWKLPRSEPPAARAGRFRRRGPVRRHRWRAGRRPLSRVARAVGHGALETISRGARSSFSSRHVLGLKPPIEAASPEEMEARKDKGTLVHAFLENFTAPARRPIRRNGPRRCREDLFKEVFDATFAAKPAGLYPVLWEALRERMRRQLLIFSHR